jgi:hypothetical protein
MEKFIMNEEEEKPKKQYKPRQNKRSRRAARQVNVFLNPELQTTPDEDRKLGRVIPKTRRDLNKIIDILNKSMRAEDKSLPREVSAFHLTAIKKAMVIAFRDNKEPIETKCKKCGEKLTILVNDPKSELNTVKMLEILYDRMFPKLASLTHEVNIAGQIVQVTEGFVGIIAKYVPAQDRLMAIGEMQQLIERLKYAAETGSEENNISNLPLAITG